MLLTFVRCSSMASAMYAVDIPLSAFSSAWSLIKSYTFSLFDFIGCISFSTFASMCISKENYTLYTICNLSFSEYFVKRSCVSVFVIKNIFIHWFWWFLLWFLGTFLQNHKKNPDEGSFGFFLVYMILFCFSEVYKFFVMVLWILSAAHLFHTHPMPADTPPRCFPHAVPGCPDDNRFHCRSRQSFLYWK